MKTKWILMCSMIAAGGVARAQPADPAPAGGAPATPADPQGGTATTTPVTEQAELHLFHALQPTKVYGARDVNSAVTYVLDTGEQVSPKSTAGDWTFIETPKGGGWVASNAIGEDGVPKDPYGPEKPAKPAKVRPPDPRVAMPQVWTTPTGWLLPAAVLYSRSKVDTGGGVTTDNRVGLGDVAEFGISSTDEVRAKGQSSDASKAIQPYVTATFRMGVAEDRLFANQPGLVLGFRKSFERTADAHTSRIAELTLVASKHLGKRAALHVGGSFWDASLKGSSDGIDTALHDRAPAGNPSAGHSVSDQMRVFGGIQVEPIDHAEILVDLGWAPEFCYQCVNPTDQIKLRPTLSWGVRYQVADWMALESGVRVPDIQAANLLDAQIFGQVTFTSWALRHVVDDLK